MSFQPIEISKIKSETPGLIDLKEIQMLERYSSNINLKNSCIVELGPFMGRSTLSLINGILKNNTREKNITLYSYDIFKINYIYKDLVELVFNLAKKFNLDKALIKKNNHIYFNNIYSFFTSKFEGKLLHTSTVDFTKEVKFKKKIGLLFLDGPKDYKSIDSVIKNFFFNLKKNSFIIFQDFFYEFATEIKYLVHILIKLKYAEVIESVSSSLVVKVIEDKINIELMLKYFKKSKNKKDMLKSLSEIEIFFENNRISNQHYQLFYPKIILNRLYKSLEYNDTKSLFDCLKKLRSFPNLVMYHGLLDVINRKFSKIKHS